MSNPGICIAHYDWPDDNGQVVVHPGFEIAHQPLTDAEDVRVVELASAEVASAIHRGPFVDIAQRFEGLVRWIEDNGCRIADRAFWVYAVKCA